VAERRSVLVTGASRGIGRACAIAFAQQRARVAINHPGESDAAAETARLVEAAGGEAFQVAADVGVVDEARRLVRDVLERFGQLDVLVLNAGICPWDSFFEIDEGAWDRVLAVNVKGAFFVAQEAARAMVAGGRGGAIVGVSSISAYVGFEQVHYCASKGALSSLLKALAVVLAPHGIRCNIVLPGPIATDINRGEGLPGRRDELEARIPLGRIGQPRDVAEVVVSLASDGSGYVNGAEVRVDGGLLVKFI
jgi:L-rhamnose 1-dehydrogenase